MTTGKLVLCAKLAENYPSLAVRALHMHIGELRIGLSARTDENR